VDLPASLAIQQTLEGKVQEAVMKAVTEARGEARAECKVAQTLEEKADLHDGRSHFTKCHFSFVPADSSEVNLAGPAGPPADFLVMEHAGAMPEGVTGLGVSWRDFVQRTMVEDVAKAFADIMVQSLAALSFLAHAGWIHHDIKMDNLVLKMWKREDGGWTPVLKLIDYGGAMEAKDEIRFEEKATNYCAPPEYQEESDGANAQFDKKYPFTWDLYMMAGLLVELLVGASWQSVAPYALAAWYVKAESRTFFTAHKSIATYTQQLADKKPPKNLMAIILRTRWLFTQTTLEGTNPKQVAGPMEPELFVWFLKQWREGGQHLEAAHDRLHPDDTIYKSVWVRLNTDHGDFLHAVHGVLAKMLSSAPEARGTAEEHLWVAKQLQTQAGELAAGEIEDGADDDESPGLAGKGHAALDPSVQVAMGSQAMDFDKTAWYRDPDDYDKATQGIDFGTTPFKNAFKHLDLPVS